VILVDTSVWVDHLRARDETLFQLLDAEQVLIHPFVIGEVALGHLRRRRLVLDTLRIIPQAPIASHGEVLHFIDEHGLFGFGIGYVDVHLLASAQLTAGVKLWTRDKRLLDAANRLALAANLPP
jgi:predicted nucleic acid-binding protein